MRGVKTLVSWLAGISIISAMAYDSLSLHRYQKTLEQKNTKTIANISSELNTAKEQLLRTQSELSLVQEEYTKQEKELSLLTQQHQASCAGAHEALINEIMRDRNLYELGINDVKQQTRVIVEDAKNNAVVHAKEKASLEKRISKNEKDTLTSMQALGLNLDPLMERLRNQCVRISANGKIGSGTLVAKETSSERTAYFALTAYHVLEGSMRVNHSSGKLEFDVPVTALCSDGGIYVCSVVLGNSSSDLALISFEARTQYSTARIASRSHFVQLDSRVYSVGHPLGVIGARITEGKISAVTTSEGITYLHPTAPSIYGCSGGGLYNSQGKLIGVNHAVAVTPLAWTGTSVASLFKDDVSVALPTMPVATGLNEVHKTLEPHFSLVCCSDDLARSSSEAIKNIAKICSGVFSEKIITLAQARLQERYNARCK